MPRCQGYEMLVSVQGDEGLATEELSIEEMELLSPTGRSRSRSGSGAGLTQEA